MTRICKKVVCLLAMGLPMVAILLTAFMHSVSAQSSEKILIIANNDVSISNISLGEVKALFLKQRTAFGEGGKAVPVHAKLGTVLRQEFQKRVLGMDAASEKAYWESQKMKSGIKPPAEFRSTARAVFSIKGGISYCFESQFKKGTAKVLLVI